MINIFYEDTEDLGLDPDFFALWISRICKAEEKGVGEISIVFCSDEYLLEMNKQYLDHDYYTDIITFDYYTEDISGDLFISINRVKENAESNNVPFDNELKRVVSHGVLHLLGYGDKSEEESLLMRKKENEALALI